MNAPDSFTADLRRFEQQQIESDLAADAIGADAQDEMCGDCSPYLAENIAEAMENLVHLDGFDAATLPQLAAASKSGDSAEFGRLMLAAIENYWIAEAMRIAQRRFERSR